VPEKSSELLALEDADAIIFRAMQAVHAIPVETATASDHVGFSVLLTMREQGQKIIRAYLRGGLKGDA
jgi:hypothetical protein